MNGNLVKEHSGYCPTFDEERTVTRDYIPIQAIGSPAVHYVPNLFDCPDSYQCPLSRECPIMKQVQKKEG